ncbi:unnamed protein product [Citrullus colocynthis]|uniref:Uncharacterized protein n=1 Tax=Citrullus colocynthis TaxID=252529 RepID=A0ABP0YQQ0_9ROSI
MSASQKHWGWRWRKNKLSSSSFSLLAVSHSPESSTLFQALDRSLSLLESSLTSIFSLIFARISLNEGSMFCGLELKPISSLGNFFFTFDCVSLWNQP